MSKHSRIEPKKLVMQNQKWNTEVQEKVVSFHTPSNLLNEASSSETSVKRLKAILEYTNMWEVQQKIIANLSFPIKEAIKAARKNETLYRSLTKRADLPDDVFNNILCKTNDLSFSIKNVDNDKTFANSLTTLAKRYKLNGETGKYNHAEVAFLLKHIVSHKNADATTLLTVARKIKTSVPSAAELAIFETIVSNPKASGETLVHCFSKKGMDINQLRRTPKIKKALCGYLEQKGYGENLKDLPWEWILSIMEEAT